MLSILWLYVPSSKRISYFYLIIIHWVLCKVAYHECLQCSPKNNMSTLLLLVWMQMLQIEVLFFVKLFFNSVIKSWWWSEKDESLWREGSILVRIKLAKRPQQMEMKSRKHKSSNRPTIKITLTWSVNRINNFFARDFA